MKSEDHPHLSRPVIGDNRLPELAASIKAAHDDVERKAKEMAERAIEAGRLLIEAKERVAHGSWLPWLRDHAGMSERTARRYMALARSGIKSATVADLGVVGALNRVADIKAIPIPRAGETVVCLAEDGIVFLWPDKHDAKFSYILAFIDTGPETGFVVATRKSVRFDLVHTTLLRGKFGDFDFSAAEVSTLSNYRTDWLDNQRRLTAPTWHEQQQNAAI